MATFKEALTTSLTNFAKSIAKTYPKTANIVDNLLSTDSTLPLSAKQGNVLKGQIDELNSHTHNYAGSDTAGGAANSTKKLQTPRKINGVAFDGSADIITSCGKYSKVLSNRVKGIGWYRIACKTPSPQYVGSLTLVRRWSSDTPEAYTILISQMGPSYNFAQLLGTGLQSIKKVRILRSTSNPYNSQMYFDIYIDNATNNNPVSVQFNNLQGARFDVDDYMLSNLDILMSPVEIPEGYVSEEFELSNNYGSYFKVSKIDELTVGSISGVNYAGSSSAGGAATTAIKDGNGNIITETYALKSIYDDSTINLGRKANTIVGTESVALGSDVTASGDSSHAEGSETTASGFGSHAEGYSTIALTNQHAQGHYNDTTLAKANSESGISDGTAFVIGNGTISVKSNAFRVTGKGQAIGKTSFASSGADYAEYFEWEDGNNENEDRVGYFVTLGNGNYIKKASEGDYILGVVSGLPCVIGNNDECWKKQFLMDEWGRFIYETQTYTDEKTGETHEVTFYKVNPDYDSSKEYIHREDRKEWSAIGMFGVLSVYDDGSCQVNSYCKCTNGGIATACERGIDSYRVIERVTDNIVKIVLK